MNGQRGGYDAQVREYFKAPVHAGDLQGRYAVMVSGEAAESASGCMVRISAGIGDGMLREVRYRVWGCPHLIAAAEAWCRQVEGMSATAVWAPAVPELMSALAVPVEKTGRLLLLEDAWLSLARQLTREQNGS